MRYLLCLALLGSFAASSLRAQEAKYEVKMDEDTKKATARALEYLAGKQNSDGSWSDGPYNHNTAITAYAMLAFMAQGHLPGQGHYGPEVAKAARFLMASARKSDGYLVGARGGNMYCHAMATLALAELWGQSGDDDIKPVLQKAVDLIVRSQNPQGGWRYEPAPTGADISVTIMTVMALRSGKNGGIHVPDTTLKKAIEYIRRCYNRPSGGFAYQPGGHPGFARTAAGACVLILAGEYSDKEIPPAIAYLKKNFDSPVHFYYGHYYASHAMHSYAGVNPKDGPKDWSDWYGRLVTYFVKSRVQSSDGSWTNTNRREVGPVYQTSIAVIVLSVPAHYLPIFQR
jgi:Prenyltransferase and squalene oxidase repeat